MPRWQHSERGFLDPSAFIPLAEKIGLINKLSCKVYKEALEQTSEFIFREKLKTAVNFSITSFSNQEFSNLVASMPEKMGISPANVILELAENQVDHNSFSCAEFMMRMRLQSFGLSIDHFGGSQSSMLQLKKIPFTEMKIDRAFVNGAINDSTSRAILEASISLAKTLGMEIVAVGVESKEDWNLVEELGCDYAQGFYCSQPVYHDDLTSFIESWTGPY